MVGRGVIARPSLGREIAASRGNSSQQIMFDWIGILEVIAEYHQLIKAMNNPPRQAGRLKQWIKLLARNYEEAGSLFMAIRRFDSPDEILREVELTQERVFRAA